MITAYLIGSTFITVMVDGNSHTIASDHTNFDKVKKAIKDNDLALVENLINVKSSLINYVHGKIKIEDDIVTYNGRVINSSLVERILEMMRDGFNVDSMLNFLENLMNNPSHQAVQELYGFLEVGMLPITTDGHFLAYKRVNDNYLDFFSGTVDHSIGTVVTMDRNQVDDNRHRTCSTGLHFCSLKYLPSYHSNEGKIIIVKINPADVVSIPTDYNNTKGRACRYEVIGEYTGPESKSAFTSSVYDNMTPVTPTETYTEEDSDSYFDYNDDADESDGTAFR